MLRKENREHPVDSTVYKTRDLTFADLPTQAITAAADGGGGTVNLTIADHQYLDGDLIDITGTTSYNGTDIIVTYVDKDTIKITDTFVATETGTSAFAASIATDKAFIGRALPNSKETDPNWQIKRARYSSSILIGYDFPRKNDIGESHNFWFKWSAKTTYLYGA